ncbi:hypothetical protein HGI30_21900 [Paenibacillus albicereus]|uniref:Uncharacterized protein n=1 Tax=Paenibacillus albicereus TaxID=2726185 RepID=A0A6H2H2Q4_9BACL|nr:hypothetical protein [Paenibacillus albicereus]QJC53915.1 hypothetical protein HGI30_21900 [Paenibacillus albicereus]
MRVDLQRSLRMLYMLESPWWIHASMDEEAAAPPRRFQREMRWLAERMLQA